MAHKITFISNQQAHHLEVARQLTGSDGFMSDARAIAAYLPGETSMDLLAVAVFECFRGGRAELHLGCVPGRRLTPEIITTVSTVAFHPSLFGVETLICRVPVQNVKAFVVWIKNPQRGDPHPALSQVIWAVWMWQMAPESWAVH